jgi:hypothetical protein
MQSARAVFNFRLWRGRVYFSILAHTWHDFRDRAIELKMGVLIFPATFFFFNISRSKKNLVKYYHTFT